MRGMITIIIGQKWSQNYVITWGACAKGYSMVLRSLCLKGRWSDQVQFFQVDFSIFFIETHHPNSSISNLEWNHSSSFLSFDKNVHCAGMVSPLYRVWYRRQHARHACLDMIERLLCFLASPRWPKKFGIPKTVEVQVCFNNILGNILIRLCPHFQPIGWQES